MAIHHAVFMQHLMKNVELCLFIIQSDFVPLTEPFHDG